MVNLQAQCSMISKEVKLFNWIGFLEEIEIFYTCIKYLYGSTFSSILSLNFLEFARIFMRKNGGKSFY